MPFGPFQSFDECLGDMVPKYGEDGAGRVCGAMKRDLEATGRSARAAGMYVNDPLFKKLAQLYADAPEDRGGQVPRGYFNKRIKPVLDTLLRKYDVDQGTLIVDAMDSIGLSLAASDSRDMKQELVALLDSGNLRGRHYVTAKKMMQSVRPGMRDNELRKMREFIDDMKARFESSLAASDPRMSARAANGHLRYAFRSAEDAQDFVNAVLSRGLRAGQSGLYATVLKPGLHAADVSDLARSMGGKPAKSPYAARAAYKWVTFEMIRRVQEVPEVIGAEAARTNDGRRQYLRVEYRSGDSIPLMSPKEVKSFISSGGARLSARAADAGLTVNQHLAEMREMIRDAREMGNSGEVKELQRSMKRLERLKATRGSDYRPQLNEWSG